MKIWNNGKIILLLCCTLGLAPFLPEPHIWGKLKWVAGGAVGMQSMDWLDLGFHGWPWLLLIIFLLKQLLVKLQIKPNSTSNKKIQEINTANN